MPPLVSLMATSKCNHQCTHCYINDSFYWDPNDIKKAAKKLMEKYTVVMNGAEILLEPAYLDTYKIIGQQYIFSNGIVFDSHGYDQIIARLRESGINIICLSHHFKAINTLNAVGADLVERITAKLIHDKFEVHYNTTITTQNYLNIENMCDLAYTIGIKSIKFFILKNAGNSANINHNLYLTDQQTDVFYKLLKNCRLKYQLPDLKIQVAGDLSRNTEKFKCTYGIDTFAITPNYKVYGCVFSISSQNEIGYLDEEYNIILYSPIRHNQKRCLIGWN